MFVNKHYTEYAGCRHDFRPLHTSGYAFDELNCLVKLGSGQLNISKSLSYSN